MAYKKKDGTVISDEWMDAMADSAENGRLPGLVTRTEIGPGRPKIFSDDELENVTFRIRKSRLPLIDMITAASGMSRSEFFREAVEEKLEALRPSSS